jgi:hypothetical protein
MFKFMGFTLTLNGIIYLKRDNIYIYKMGEERTYLTIEDFLSGEDFLRGAKDCNVVEEVFQELYEQREREIIDLAALRRGQDWSYLSGQIVGAEV